MRIIKYVLAKKVKQKLGEEVKFSLESKVLKVQLKRLNGKKLPNANIDHVVETSTTRTFGIIKSSPDRVTLARTQLTGLFRTLVYEGTRDLRGLKGIGGYPVSMFPF